MPNLSSAPYPILNSLIAKTAKEINDYHTKLGGNPTNCDGWALSGSGFILVDSVRFYMLGFTYIVNNLDAYGTVVQPIAIRGNFAPIANFIVGRKDWLALKQEQSLIPAGFNIFMI